MDIFKWMYEESHDRTKSPPLKQLNQAVYDLLEEDNLPHEIRNIELERITEYAKERLQPSTQNKKGNEK